MSLTHEIRVFCPVHEASFDVERNPKILCEITGHTLANTFPTSEVWEFCCNCNTYSPTKLDKGEKARGYCFSCQSEIAMRTLCANCKMSSFAAKSKSKGQQHAIDDNGLTPSCPGCGVESPKKPVRHKCDEAAAVFLTSVETCPFCLEKTSVDFVLPHHHPSAAQNLCPRCDAANPETAPFCGKCGFPLKAGVVVEKAGTTVPRTAVGTLCPNCSYPMPADADFCGECGQAVKRSIAPPPPPPSNRPATEAPKSFGEVISISGSKINPAILISIIVGGLFIVIFSVLALNSGSQNSRNTNVAANNASHPYTNSYNAAANAANAAANAMANAVNTPANANPTSANSNSSQPSHPMIGRTATLNWDVPMRQEADRNATKYGFQYKGARVRVIDVEENVPSDKGGGIRWYKIKVLSFGRSVDERNGSMEKDPGSLDEGWIAGKRDVWVPPDLKKELRNRMMLIFDK